MEKREDALQTCIISFTEKFLKFSGDKEILVISHFDTDGISSAAIIIKTLKKLDKKFSVKIVKRIEENFIQTLPKNKLILFLDLASSSFRDILKAELENVFIIDHHEINQVVPEKIHILNPELNGKEKISSAGLTYLFSKELIKENKELAKLAVLGMVGDRLESELDKLNNGILNDSEIKTKRGLLIYPSTRPINRVLEYSSNPFIPGVTGDTKGVLELLREAGLKPEAGKYKSLIELNDKEMQNLVTGILLRNPKKTNKEILGDIYLIKLFNKLEDVRELSAMINACSRYGDSGTALQLCIEISSAKKQAETIHAKYKQQLISGIRFAEQTKKIQTENLVIINAQNNIPDTMIGTITSILSNSPLYPEGTTIIGMAYYTEGETEKIKISSRSVGNQGRNLREVLDGVVNKENSEVGGHKFAAGATIPREHEQQFIDSLVKAYEVEVVKV